MNFEALALDPGGTTGYTIAWKRGNVVKVRPEQKKMNPQEFMKFLKTRTLGETIVICEDFEFRKMAREGLDLTPAHLIGVLYAIMGEDNPRLRMQRAAYAKTGFYTDSALKKANIYIPGKPHAMDSLRHFMQWLMFGPGYRYHDAEKEIVVELEPAKKAR